MAANKVSPKECIDILKKEFGLDSQRAVADFLGLSQGRISQINKKKRLTKRAIKSIMTAVYRAGSNKTKKSVCSESNKKLLSSFGEMNYLDTQEKIATALGVTRESVAQWSSGNSQIPQPTIKKILKKQTPL